MQTRHLNLLLFSVVIVLGAVLWRDLRPTPVSVTPLTTMSAGQATRIRIDRDGQEGIELVRDDGQWRMVRPWPARADVERVNRLLGVLGQPTGDDFAAAEVNLKELGLDQPQATLTVDDLELRFGGATPLNHRRYVQTGGRVHLLEDRYLYQLMSRASDFADPHPLPPDASIDALRLPDLSLSRGDKGWLVEPSPDPRTHSADAPQVLVDAWRHASAMAVERVDAPVDGSAEGLGWIEIRLRGHAAPLRFGLLDEEDGVRLIDPDSGLAWRFSRLAAERLLKLPELVPDA